MSTFSAVRAFSSAPWSPALCWAMCLPTTVRWSFRSAVSRSRAIRTSRWNPKELTITPEFVTVRYVFLNQSQKPVNVTVAFPLPDIDLADADNYAIPTDDPMNFVAFQTKIDGKPVTFSINQRALLAEKDVSARIKSAGLPVLPIGTQQNRISELSAEVKDRLIEEGLLIPAGTNAAGQPLHGASWTVRTSIVRQQTFPPGKPVVVEHRYRTSMGVSFDTVLRKALRENTAMTAEVKRYRSEYCVPDESCAESTGSPAARREMFRNARTQNFLRAQDRCELGWSDQGFQGRDRQGLARPAGQLLPR